VCHVCDRAKPIVDDDDDDYGDDDDDDAFFKHRSDLMLMELFTASLPCLLSKKKPEQW
jgi:hypothetical protein